MKKALLLMALFAGSLLSANAQDHLSAYVKPGEVKQLAIQLANDLNDYTAFQMTINLPEGMTFAGDPVLSNRKDAHQVHFKKSDDNKTMTVATFSFEEADGVKTGNLAFKNKKGAVLLVDVNVTGTFKETSCDVSGITVSNVEFVKKSDLTGSDLALASQGKLGDVNGDKKLDTVDATLILMKSGSMTFTGTYNEEAQDVDCDGVLNTVDATEVLLETLR